jgi:two-component system response regulator RegX3
MDVLIVEDDDGIAVPLEAGLERAGYTCRRVATGQEALDAPLPDLVLLDLGLPDIDGIDVCRQIRARSDVPIIVVTARGEEVDRVIGLEMGADDYLVKPFGIRELVARIRAVQRRLGVREPSATVLDAGAVQVDLRTHRAEVDGKEVALTPKEFDLLALLARDPGATFPREQIIEEVWDAHWFGPTKTLDVHIASLRKKIGDATLIETVRGVGFRLRVAGVEPA